MDNQGIQKDISKIVAEKYGGDYSINDLVGFFFDCGIADLKRCRIALIRRRFHELIQGEDMKIGTAKDIVADEFGISNSSVDMAIYYFKDIHIK